MQVNQPQGGNAKASTPAADLRLVSVTQLQQIHRALDACQKVIWLAGVRPRGDFDPAYVTDAQARLKEIEALLSEQAVSGWTKQKPTRPGAYYVRGFRLGEEGTLPALVEVRMYEAGVLITNIHERNSEDDLNQWSQVSDCADRFEWLGPLAASNIAHEVDQLRGHVHDLCNAAIREGAGPEMRKAVNAAVACKAVHQ